MSLQWKKNGEALNKSIGWAAGEKNDNIVHEDPVWIY